MPHLHSNHVDRALNRLHTAGPPADHLEARAHNRLHAPASPPRVIEIGEVTAGITVPEPGGVRFFASTRDFAPLDGLVFRSVEQAAKAARDRLAARRPSHHRPAAIRLVASQPSDPSERNRAQGRV